MIENLRSRNYLRANAVPQKIPKKLKHKKYQFFDVEINKLVLG